MKYGNALVFPQFIAIPEGMVFFVETECKSLENAVLHCARKQEGTKTSRLHRRQTHPASVGAEKNDGAFAHERSILMANESRSFRMIGGTTIESIVDAVETYCRVNKSMETRSSKTTDGYVLQASQPGDGWKTISGTRLAITTQFMVIGDVLTVTVGQGQWADKVGAAAVGWFIAWPFAITAGIGALRQKRVPEEIFQVIERTILTGGLQVVINGAGSILKENTVICPVCKTHNAGSSRFCSHCGTPLLAVCPDCGQPVAADAKFCPSCGHNMAAAKKTGSLIISLSGRHEYHIPGQA